MNKVYICEIDAKLNEGRCLSAEGAIKRVKRYITRTIDPTFPEDEFMSWLESDSEKPFKWNRNNYYWNTRS